MLEKQNDIYFYCHSSLQYNIHYILKTNFISNHSIVIALVSKLTSKLIISIVLLPFCFANLSVTIIFLVRSSLNIVGSLLDLSVSLLQIIHSLLIVTLTEFILSTVLLILSHVAFCVTLIDISAANVFLIYSSVKIFSCLIVVASIALIAVALISPHLNNIEISKISLDL